MKSILYRCDVCKAQRIRIACMFCGYESCECDEGQYVSLCCQSFHYSEM